MNIHFFDSREFRDWLEKNHDTATEVIIGFYKKASGKQKMDWSSAVDQAICFGWIDGIRHSLDPERYRIRFTPRKADSIWSKVNIGKVGKLIEQDLMKPSGLSAFEKRKSEKSGIYSFENDAKTLTAEMESHFKSNKKAWDFFSSQPRGNKKLNIFRVMSAKQEKTRWSRLEKLIAASEAGIRIN